MKYIIAILSLISCTLSAQVLDFNFNDCSLADASGTYADATSMSVPDCECGLIENGLYLDGNLDNLIFDENIDSTFSEDFTISFYFRMDNVTTNTDIFSIKNNCDLDSLFDMVYRPSSNMLQVQLGNTLASLEARQIELDQSKCWHRFALTKSGLLYTWYIDNERREYVSPTTLEFGQGASMAIANSPCLINGSITRFRGWIDEFRIFPRALSAVELRTNDLMADQILTGDTTIVAGESVNISTGPTCATNFTWSPTGTIDDPSMLDIVVNPTETTEYSISFANTGGCLSQDTVTIFVIDEAALDCEQLLLPNAFTPNNDALNDRYGISNLFLVQEIEFFEIYDRWGAKVWETSDKAETWDGSFNGTSVNPGMFIYKIKYTCKDEEFVKLDNFSVLR